MGFNPHRRSRARPSDYVMVAVAILVALSLVFWAILG